MGTEWDKEVVGKVELFAADGQSIGASVSASVLPMSIQD